MAHAPHFFMNLVQFAPKSPCASPVVELDELELRRLPRRNLLEGHVLGVGAQGRVVEVSEGDHAGDLDHLLAQAQPVRAAHRVQRVLKGRGERGSRERGGNLKSTI